MSYTVKIQDLQGSPIVENDEEDGDILEEAARIKDHLQILGISPNHPNHNKYIDRLKQLKKTDPHAYHKAINLD